MKKGQKMRLLREEMVDRQLKKRGIRNKLVLDAFLTVPRHRFVPGDMQELAYRDGPLPIDEGQTISQPYIVAEMVEALNLVRDDEVLEVGTGSGYATAILSRIVKKVYSIERFQLLAKKAEKLFQSLNYDNIEIEIGDGTKGWQKKAPFAGILVSAAAPEIPEGLKLQLKKGGYLVVPVGDKNIQELLQIKYKGDDIYNENSMGMVRFVPLVGEEGWKEVEEIAHE